MALGTLAGQSCGEKCDDSICDCGELNGINPYFDTQGVGNFSSGFYEQNGDWTYISASESDLEIPADRYGIEVSFVTETYGAQLMEDGIVKSSKKGSFISAAYACNPPPPGFLGSQERITDIEITSDMDFSTLFPAGSSLTDKFFIHPFVAPDRDILLQSQVFLVDDFAQNQVPAVRDFTLLLRETPDNPIQRFKVTYTLDFSEIYEIQLDSVTIVAPTQ